MIFYIPSDVTIGLTKFINLLTYHNTNNFINMKELVNYLGVILMLIGVAVFVYYHFAVIGGGNGYLYVGLGCVIAGLFAHIIVNKRIR